MDQHRVVARPAREIEDRLHDSPVRRDKARPVLSDVVKRQFQMPFAPKRTMVLALVTWRQQRKHIEPVETGRNMQ